MSEHSIAISLVVEGEQIERGGALARVQQAIPLSEFTMLEAVPADAVWLLLTNEAGTALHRVRLAELRYTGFPVDDPKIAGVVYVSPSGALMVSQGPVIGGQDAGAADPGL